MVADFLAKEGAGGKIRDFEGNSVDPGRLLGLLRTDALELPYLRLKS